MKDLVCAQLGLSTVGRWNSCPRLLGVLCWNLEATNPGLQSPDATHFQLLGFILSFFSSTFFLPFFLHLSFFLPSSCFPSCHAQGMQKFRGQRSTPSHSRDCARSLTHCITGEPLFVYCFISFYALQLYSLLLFLSSH